MTAVASWYRVYPGYQLPGNQVVRQGQTLFAAHPWLPMGTKIRVTTQKGRSIELEVRDLGPAPRVIKKDPNRTLDLTPDAAKALGFGPKGEGLMPVTIEVLSD